MTKCYECKYEHSDCKGNKQDDCPNFAKRGAFNYHAKIRELESTLKQADEAYDVQGKQLLEAQDRIKKLEADLEMQKNMTAVWSNRAEEEVKARANKTCDLDCAECTEKCRVWQNGYNAKGGNMSFDSVQMLHRIVEEVTPDWYNNNCISCAWFNNLKGVGGYCAYHNKSTTAKGGCNKWAKECDTE